MHAVREKSKLCPVTGNLSLEFSRMYPFRYLHKHTSVSTPVHSVKSDNVLTVQENLPLFYTKLMRDYDKQRK